MKLWKKNTMLIFLVVIISFLPLWLVRDGEFGGADGQAEEMITTIAPDYTPWFAPLMEPASGEIESLLFALQAAIGSGIMMFLLGRMTAKGKKDEASA